MLTGPGTIRFHNHVQMRAFAVQSIIGEFHSFHSEEVLIGLGTIWISKEASIPCATLRGVLQMLLSRVEGIPQYIRKL